MTFLKKREQQVFLGILVYILLFGIAYSLYLGSNFRFIDEKDYYTIARNIAFTFQRSLDGVHPSAYHCPGYPFFLSIFIFFGANIVFLRFLNFIALALSVYLLYCILKEEAPGLSGVIGSLLVVCYPVLFYTAGMLYPQTIAGTMLLGIVYWGRGIGTRLPRPEYRQAGRLSYYEWARNDIIVGLLFGALILFVPALVLLMVPFLGWVAVVRRKTRLPRHKTPRNDIVIIGMVALAMVGCWTLRNYLVFRQFVFINSNSGVVLLLGNSENTTPNAGVNVDISRYAKEADRLGLDEIGRDRYYQEKALEFIRNNKAKALKLYFLKLLNYFNYRNELGTKAEAARWKDVLMLITWGPLLALFLVRLLFVVWVPPHLRPLPVGERNQKGNDPPPRERKLAINRFEGLLILLYFAGALIHALFCTRIRYRLPFDFLLIMVVALFLERGFPLTIRGNDKRYALKFRNN